MITRDNVVEKRSFLLVPKCRSTEMQNEDVLQGTLL